ncbi:MAG TPA: hypothetical protein VHB70_16630 [Parafilimonas sp.]|nr:hypothetical protein [Parafilimonas sp.]
MKYIFNLATITCLLLICFDASAQLKDTIHETKRNNIFHYALGFIKRNSADTNTQQGLLTTKSEEVFRPYEGKIIRHIFINQYGFEKTFTDTTQRINYSGTRLLNKLHKNTREWAIRDALFIKENTTVVAYRLADNERYLRSLDYIQDARILIQPVDGAADSVDVYVITKDLFSLNGEVNDLSTGKFRGKIGDVNLLGAAQNLQANVLLQNLRSPAFGAGLMYTKYNIKNSFIDASVGYSSINPDLRDGTDDEHAAVFTLQRDLISQYSHVAGGFTLGMHQTYNSYLRPPEIFFDYKYTVFDAWIGYNLGVKKFIKDETRKDKQFIGVRYFNNHFQNSPIQVDDKLNFRFNNQEAWLAQFTFFKQEYYKTNYIYGFGTTEDIPYGYNVSFTSGFYKQAYLSRPYAGVDANFYKVYPKGDIVQYFIRTGSFWDKKQMEDAQVLIGASGFSKLFLFRNFKLRQYEQLSFARQFNRVGLDPLSIDNFFGIRYFRDDSVRGNQRISLHSETISFINYKLFGFKFSPFVFTDISGLTPEKNFQKTGWYYGVGGGLRMRNENLVFKTAELRIVYFPRKANQTNSFAAFFRINIQFRYNSNYVRKPDIVQLNNDYQNNVF